jgi:hypothetical protein
MPIKPTFMEVKNGSAWNGQPPNLTAGTDLNAELATVVATKSTAAAPDQSLTQTMLGMSLGLIDVTPSAKRWLASHMMFGLR